MKKNISIIFALFSAIYLVGLSYPTNISWLLKIVPIAVLAMAVLKTKSSKTNTYLLIALGFSATGDTLLEMNLFIYGVGAFLLAQLSYATLFARHWKGLNQRWPLSLGLLVYIFLMAYILLPNLGDLQLPVIAYLIAISFMGLMAIQSDYPLRWAVLGALVFISSDSLIAIDKFLHPIPGRSYWIMLTYYGAQWMLIDGALRRSNR